MSRFATARALFDEFPTLAQATKLEPTDEDPVAFLRAVTGAGKLREAVAICAYLLPKREAVWWTCQCLRSVPQVLQPEDQCVPAAEAWAREPTEEARDIALRWGRASDQQAPATFAAYAAGFTSGNLAELPDGPVRTPAHMTAENARVALVLAECKLEPDAGKDFLRACLSGASRLIETSARQASRATQG
jgi:hypothetical protein